MSNQEIITKAMQIATSRGLSWGYMTALLSVSTYQLIFDPEFAKALWGEHEEGFYFEKSYYLKTVAWKGHLQQMVIAEDKFKYLKENI